MGEFVQGLIFLFIAIGVIRFIWRLLRTGGAAAKATFDSTTGRSTFADSYNESLGGFGELKFRAIKQTSTEKGKSFDTFVMQFKGLFPHNLNNRKLSFIFNIFDNTNEKDSSVITCPIDGFNEGHTLTYQFTRPLGPIATEHGYPDWTIIGLAPIEFLKFPKKGNLKLKFQCCVTLEGQEPHFNYGGVEDKNNILKVFTTSLDYYNAQTGYLEISENRKKVEKAIIQFGFYVAAVDGEIAKKEGLVIKEWCEDQVSSAIKTHKDEVKERLNEDVKVAHDSAKKKDLSLSQIVKNLNDNASKIEKYEALELALKVMKADGVADPEELTTLDNIAREIDIDPDEYRKLREQGIATVEVVAEKEDSSTTGTPERKKELARLIGFAVNDNKEQINKILIQEGKKWLGRSNVEDKTISRNAKNMIRLIAEARKTFIS